MYTVHILLFEKMYKNGPRRMMMLAIKCLVIDYASFFILPNGLINFVALYVSFRIRAKGLTYEHLALFINIF